MKVEFINRVLKLSELLDNAGQMMIMSLVGLMCNTSA